jgi:hypothetical protein
MQLAEIVRPLWHDVDNAQISGLPPEVAAQHLYGRRHRTTGRVLTPGRLDVCDLDERDRLEKVAMQIERGLGVETEAK